MDGLEDYEDDFAAQDDGRPDWLGYTLAAVIVSTFIFCGMVGYLVFAAR
jgi:hypothetical protein